MSWRQTTLAVPPSLVDVCSQTSGVLDAIPAEQEQALQRLTALGERAGWRRHPLGALAQPHSMLRAQWEAWLAQGWALTVTPFQHRVALRPGTLSAPNAIKALIAKLRDQDDPLRPSGPLFAIGWMVAARSHDELASRLQPLCQALPLPDWCAVLRRLQAQNDPMQQPKTPTSPHWSPRQPLIWDPLRQARRVSGSVLGTIESLASDAATPLAKLARLAEKKAAHLAQEQAVITDLQAAIAGTLWRWQGHGEVESLASELERSLPDDHTSCATVASLLLSPAPLTFWQELTP
ncbi:hypothetical protein [Aeromonas schubertii]|uniref:Uncharacterized protein n=1 Tax=Aeromonas schubertii TaxID=652 RepID=A0A0S2SME1_9GAMM|nr:hypothetical protein [Aeromonas schubertii]ALP42907.1 hypothetical protein WL1483_3488 [Aeromonas schubertii]